MEKELYRKIKYINRYKVRWIMMWITLLLTCVAVCSLVEDGGFAIACEAAGFALCILFPLEYYRKYNNLIADRSYKDQDLAVVGDLFQKAKLSAILRCHSFSAKRYVMLLAVRLIPFQIIALILNVFLYIYGLDTMSDMQKYAGAGITFSIIVFPFCVAFIYCRYIEKNLTSESSSASKKIWGIWLSAVINVAMFACNVLCAFCFLLFVMIGLIDSIAMEAIVDDSIVCVSHGGDIQSMFMFLLFMAFLYLMWDQGNDFISPRVAGKLRIIVGIALFGLMIYCPVSTILNHIELRDNGITVVKHGKSMDYAFEDITHYQIYPKDSSLKIAVDFSNGTREELFRDMIDEGQTFDERVSLDSEYDNYTEDLEYGSALYFVKRLNELGIGGEIKDVEELRKISKEYDDPEIVRTFVEIEKCVGVAEP